MLSTSICNEFDAGLCTALTGSPDSARTLDEIESKILFMVRLGGEGSWYRYHHLFREFLRETLRKRYPSAFSVLNVSAAEYFISTGDRRQAIQHYIQASEFELALALLEAESEQLSHEGLLDTLGNWIELIPADQRAARPRLLLDLARAYQTWGRNDEAIELLNQAISTFNDRGESLMEAQALMHRSDSLRFKAAHRMAIRDGKKALALVREHGTTADHAKARHHLGSAYAQQGRFCRETVQGGLEGFSGRGKPFSAISDPRPPRHCLQSARGLSEVGCVFRAGQARVAEDRKQERARRDPFSYLRSTAASALSTVSSGTQRSRLRISSWPGKGGRR